MRWADSYADCVPPDDRAEQAHEDAKELLAGAISNDRKRLVAIVADEATTDDALDSADAETPAEALANAYVVLGDAWRALHGYDCPDSALAQKAMADLRRLSALALGIIEGAINAAVEKEWA